MGSAPTRAASEAPPPDSGQVIAGKYRVERVIGEGGMGTVLAARHELLDVPVAVKVLSAELSHQPSIIARFLREARAVARLKSEHVARVMDVGTIGEGQPFIVMELLDGEDLEKRLTRGPLPVPQAADFLLQALEAMAHAHVIGIVHRDLKPANLFLIVTPDGREVVKVLDFGIAKLTNAVAIAGGAEGARSGGLTGEHTTLGSPSYMAPEQVRALPEIDRRADIWALGAILYEMVTGRTAFGGTTVGEIFGAVLHGTVPTVREVCPDAPEEVDRVIARCLQRVASDRFTDVAELARSIAPLGTGAWQGHVGRIEQTLARAGKGSDPDGSRISRLGLEAFAPEAFSPEAGSEPRSRRRPVFGSTPGAGVTPVPSQGDSTRVKNANTLVAPNNSTPAPVSTSATPPRSPRLVVGVPLGLGLLGGAVVTAAFLLRGPSPSQPPPRAASISTLPPPAPEMPPAVTAPGADTASAAAGATPPPAAVADVPSPQASALPAHAKSSPPPAHPPTAAPRHAVAPPAPAPSAGLPGVLRSPD